MTTPDDVTLPESLASVAFTEFNETPDMRNRSLIELRQMIAALPKENDKLLDVSDSNLIRFLRSRKYDMDKALQATIELAHFNSKYSGVLADITADELLLCRGFLQVVRENGLNGR